MELGTFGPLQRNESGGMLFKTTPFLTEPYASVHRHLQSGRILYRIKRKRNQ